MTSPPPLPEFRPPNPADAEPVKAAPAPKAGGPAPTTTSTGTAAAPRAEPGAGGSAQEWKALTRRFERLAKDLAALVEQLPAGEVPAEHAKALRSTVGRVGQHAGVLKRRLNIGK